MLLRCDQCDELLLAIWIEHQDSFVHDLLRWCGIDCLEDYSAKLDEHAAELRGVVNQYYARG